MGSGLRGGSRRREGRGSRACHLDEGPPGTAPPPSGVHSGGPPKPGASAGGTPGGGTAPGGGAGTAPGGMAAGGTTPAGGAPPGPGKPSPGTPGTGWTLNGLALISVGRPIRFCSGGIMPGGTGAIRGPVAPGPGSMPIACIRARCVAACVFAHGKAGPGIKYWTSSCMYLPEGNVMPAYSTWQPTEGKTEAASSAAQAAQHRPWDRRGDLWREDHIVGNLLGKLRRSILVRRRGVRSNPIPRGRDAGSARSSGSITRRGIGRGDRSSPMIPRK